MMIRRMIGAVVLSVLLAGTGCIAVVSHKSLIGTHRDAVVIDGQIYIVDTKTGSVMRMAPAEVQNAEDFVAEDTVAAETDG